MMNRRHAMTMLGGAAVWPLAAGAQPRAMRAIGFLHTSTPPEYLRRAFIQGLSEAGFNEGRNIAIVYRFGESRPERLSEMANELVRLGVEAIVTSGGSLATQAAKSAATSNPATISALMRGSRTIPIVFTMQPDPIAQKFAASLARPGSNATGFTSVEQSMAGKWLELLMEVVPGLARVAMMVDPQEPGGAILAEALTSAASARTIQPAAATVHDDAEIAEVIEALAGQPVGGLTFRPARGYRPEGR